MKDLSAGAGQVSAGAAHTLVLSQDGRTVWSFGSGDNGKLGHGDTNRVYKPKAIESLTGTYIRKVVAGSQFSLALTSTGTVSSAFCSRWVYMTWNVQISIEWKFGLSFQTKQTNVFFASVRAWRVASQNGCTVALHLNGVAVDLNRAIIKHATKRDSFCTSLIYIFSLG